MANCTRWSRVQLCHSGVYEIDKFIVYKFTVYHIVYSKLLLQVYKFTLYGLQQIAATYKSLTNQWAIILLHCWQSVFQPISELLHFFHCLHVQEKHFAVVNGANFGLWYSHIITWHTGTRWTYQGKEGLWVSHLGEEGDVLEKSRAPFGVVLWQYIL